MNHNAITGRCDSCHNGIIALGKPADHPATTQDCRSCHDTNEF
jgi:hypothetical protein